MLGPLLAVLFCVGWVPLWVFRSESIQDAIPYYSATERVLALLTPLVIAAHMTLGCMLVGDSSPESWRAVLGVNLFAIGIAFWLWARMQIGPLRRTRLPDEPPLRLRRDGAFGVVRNPLYFGILTAAAAPVVVAPQTVLVATYLATVVILGVRAAQEERRLHAQLGQDYADYCRGVKRLIPFVW
jgi:protein-S-isoprenylcysteine O-methyltransferase Ste14